MLSTGFVSLCLLSYKFSSATGLGNVLTQWPFFFLYRGARYFLCFENSNSFARLGYKCTISVAAVSVGDILGLFVLRACGDLVVLLDSSSGMWKSLFVSVWVCKARMQRCWFLV